MFSSTLKFVTLALVFIVPMRTLNAAFTDSTPGPDVERCATESPIGQDRERIEASIKAHRAKINASTCNNTLTAATINVYFHVIAEKNNTKSGMISDTVINEQIAVLNRDFRNSSLTFNLAEIDRRINATWFRNVFQKNKAESDMVAALKKGNSSSDLDIYTVAFTNAPKRGLLGYATFPWYYASNSARDGVYLNFRTLPNVLSSGHYTGKTATHEVGHWAGLLHTFDTANHTSYCDAVVGDMVEDTPQENGYATGCPRGRDSCPNDPGFDPIENFMDYSDDSCFATILALVSIVPLYTVNGALTDFTPGLDRCATEAPIGHNRERIEASIKAHRAKNNLATCNTAFNKATINVYFHVIAEGNDLKSGMISDAVINQQIDVMNHDFQNSGLTFRLVDIDRTINSVWFSDVDSRNQAESDMMAALRKGGEGDLNIYTVGFVNSNTQGLLGYATFPWDYLTESARDGVVIRFVALPNILPTAGLTGKTATHEVGHWTGLLHTFETSTNTYYCDRLVGDKVDDTPVENGPAQGCPKGRDSCPNDPGLDPIENFMDYSDDYCMTHFTPCQVTRLRSNMDQYRNVGL
ncbi:hypothetical protein CVT24_012781 [Panaeolus cyanescens]|uniref:Peptidase M43 pregnancy-associated plasma-A domain-containing protein n=1 Tax=Panaeolus cyanescens TaxID=181874 RepID=A0A409W5Y8_9AGAR|nr:hypothetical protein CVT24_012781 [Panaeolus cyanescens]